MHNAVNHWLNGAARFPLLTPDEEIQLGNQVQDWLTAENPDQLTIRRGQRAREKMIRRNMRLVVGLAKKMSYRLNESQAVAMEDLLQEGCLGLNRAAEKFEPAKGYKFSTYAYWWIRQSINRFLDYSNTIHIPSNARQISNRFSRRPKEQSVEEFAELNNSTPERIEEILSLVARAKVRSLDHVCGDDGSELGELVGDDMSNLSLEAQEIYEEVRLLRESDTEAVRDAVALIELSETTKPTELAELIGCEKKELTQQMDDLKALVREHCSLAVADQFSENSAAILGPKRTVRTLAEAEQLFGSHGNHPTKNQPEMTYSPTTNGNGCHKQIDELEAALEAPEAINPAEVEPEPQAEAKPKRRRRSRAEIESEQAPAASPLVTVAFGGQELSGTARNLALVLTEMQKVAA